MALYLKTRKLDVSTGDPLVVVIHSVDSKEIGLNSGDRVEVMARDLETFALVNITDTEVNPGEVGLYTEVWEKYQIPSGETVAINLIEIPASLELIKKKLLGKRLNESEMDIVIKDISERKIRDVEIAFFMATFFNPGFDESEVINAAKSMAKAGDILSFKDIKNNGDLVVDKHSIGGIAGKGITPIVVSIIASCDLVIPNTSTRAITAPSGTSDILEVVMPVGLTNEEVYESVKETGACMIWGGNLDLAPADDILINVERGIHMQSYQKLLMSIIAKKIAMGISHIIIDIPYGKGAKVENPEDIEMLCNSFERMSKEVGITSFARPRHVKGPDGNGVGPNLEIREVLRVLERTENRSVALENDAISIAGKLLELSGKFAEGQGEAKAREIVESRKALEKFWEIAKAQGAKKTVSAEKIEVGEYKYEVKSSKDGVVKFIDSKMILQIARSLGNPFIKTAGIFVNCPVGSSVKSGDVLMTLYATSADRLEEGKGECGEGLVEIG